MVLNDLIVAEAEGADAILVAPGHFQAYLHRHFVSLPWLALVRNRMVMESTCQTRLTRRAAVIASVVTPVALIAGCASSARDATAGMEPGTGLAFGSFDFSASDINATHVVLLRISPTKLYMGGSGERSTVTFTNGEFYAPNLSPGRYAVNAFYSGDLRVALEGNLKNNTFVVEPGRASYAGTYRVRYARKGMFQRDDGAFARVDSKQDEARLLKWLSEELARSEWVRPVRARLDAVQGS